MAIVTNLAQPGVAADIPYCTFNRTNAGDPNGTLTPQYVGEIVLDTTNHTLRKAESAANSSWVILTIQSGSL